MKGFGQMKVKELIEILKKADQEAKVLVSSDPEGNSFQHFEGITLDGRIIEDGYDVEWIGPDDAKEEGIDITDLEKCIILWP